MHLFTCLFFMLSHKISTEPRKPEIVVGQGAPPKSLTDLMNENSGDTEYTFELNSQNQSIFCLASGNPKPTITITHANVTIPGLDQSWV